MADDDEQEYSTSVGAVHVDGDGRIYLIVVMSDGENFYSRLTRLNDIAIQAAGEPIGEQYGGNFWLTDMTRTPDGHFFLADGNGNVHTEVDGAWTIEPVSPGRGLRCLWISAEGQVYAAGTLGVVYQRKSDGWEAISPPLDNWISAIGGPTHSNLLAVGNNGLVWRFDGSAWRQVELATNANFTGILWQAPDVFTICGDSGALFRGSGDEWADLSTGGGDLFKLTAYTTDIWVAAGTAGVGRLTEAGLTIVRSTFAGYRIHSAGRYLAAAGNNIVARFNGENWHGRSYQ
jgi:hypothetical protein